MAEADRTKEAVNVYDETGNRVVLVVMPTGHQVMPDNARTALELAEELTRDELASDMYVPSCKWCSTDQGTKNHEHFIHAHDCKWAQLRRLLDPCPDCDGVGGGHYDCRTCEGNGFLFRGD